MQFRYQPNNLISGERKSSEELHLRQKRSSNVDTIVSNLSTTLGSGANFRLHPASSEIPAEAAETDTGSEPTSEVSVQIKGKP